MRELYRKIRKILSQITFIKRAYNKIRGIERAQRYEQIFHAIKNNRCRRIMEVGTWNGERAVQMIETAKRHWKAAQVSYYGFDIFELMNDEIFAKEVSKRPPSMQEVKTKLENTGAKIFLFKGFTEEVMPKVMPALPKMDLVFIDGGHSIETITNDWKWTQPVMDEKTVVIFDDYWSGEWGKRKDAGCQTLIDNLDKTKFRAEILPIQDSFKKEWGVLKINFAKVRRA